MIGLVELRLSMTDSHHQYYSVGDESPSSILWDLDSSSLIVPACYRPVAISNLVSESVTTMRREISEESGYQTSSDASSAHCWPSSTAIDWPTSIDQHSWTDQVNMDDCWLLQNEQDVASAEERWEIPMSANCNSQVPDPAPISTVPSAVPAGRNGSTSSEDSDVYVPSGRTLCFKTIRSCGISGIDSQN